MAKCSEAKLEITNKLLSTFEGSFLYNGGKEIRIPIMENGEMLQIKIALTCAKTPVEPGEDVAMPSAKTVAKVEKTSTPIKVEEIQPTDEEIQNVSSLLSALGLN